MKKLIIVVTTLFIITTAWFGVKPNSEHLDIDYLEKFPFWKFYNGDAILRDCPNFKSKEFRIHNDTIFVKNTPMALLVSIELSKLKVKSLDGKQFGIYTNKRFD